MSLDLRNATKVLLSIRPEFAKKIFDGKKNFEYRKVIFSRPEVSTVVVYASAPTRRVIGEFKVARIHECTPEVLWRLTSDASGISEDKYRAYFKGRVRAYAIEIGERLLYQAPRRLEEVYGANPPQSFVYLQ
jgi:predicted transcriptional regulator